MVCNEFEIEDGKLIGYRGKAAEVVIPAGIRAIDMSAFAGCTSLQTVTLSKATHMGRIPDKVFEDCDNAEFRYV